MRYLALISFMLILGAAACRPAEQEARVEPAEEPAFATRAAVESAVRSLDALRIGLAGSMDTENVDAGTFAEVCKPVGRRAMEIGDSSGWTVRQIAVKYRNPANQADEEAAVVFPQFEANPELDSLWIRTTHEGTDGWRYLRRITVEPACLACHGAEASRPEFIQTGYPEDRAFGFEVGDLRGLYSVFVPDTSSISMAGQGPVQRLEPAQFLSTVTADAVILDVRTPEEFREGHLQHAVNIDFRSPDFTEEVAQLDRDRVYYLYCRTGNRSGQAGAIMRDLGFRELYNLGGLSDLENAGAHVVR